MYAVFDIKPSIVIDVILLSVFDPLFVGGLHVIVYKPKLS